MYCSNCLMTQEDNDNEVCVECGGMLEVMHDEEESDFMNEDEILDQAALLDSMPF